VHPSRIRADGVWRIGADGASQKPEVCNTDGARTLQLIREMDPAFKPAPRMTANVTSMRRELPAVRPPLFSTAIPMPPPIAPDVPFVASPPVPSVANSHVPKRDAPWSMRGAKKVT
jgi:hypothetical protein